MLLEMAAMECYVPEALMEQPLPQPQPQLLPLPRPREGLQEDQMSGPLPPRLRLLEVHRVQTDRHPGRQVRMEAHLERQRLMLVQVEEVTYVGIDKPAYAQKML